MDIKNELSYSMFTAYLSAAIIPIVVPCRGNQVRQYIFCWNFCMHTVAVKPYMHTCLHVWVYVAIRVLRRWNTVYGNGMEL